MSSPSPRWAIVKAKVTGLKTAFGIGGVGAFWIDAYGETHEHYENTAYDLLEWFEKQLGVFQNPTPEPGPRIQTHEQTAFEKQQRERELERISAAFEEETQRQMVQLGTTIRARLGQPQPVEMPQPKEQVKPKTHENPYRRRFG